MSYLCNRMEDRVGMLAFGAEVDSGVPQGRGGAHLREVMGFATRLAAEHVHADYLTLAAHLRRRLRHRTLVVVMTDLPEGDEAEDVVRAARLLAPQHLPLFVVLADPDLEAAARILPADHAELCRTLVARDAWTKRQAVARELRQLGAITITTPPEATGIAAMNAYIDVKRRQLL
jgi:uncharacterized protein (DUF58 family)